MKKFYRLTFWRNGGMQQVRWFISPRKMRRYWQGVLSYPDDANRYDCCDVQAYTENETGECHADVDHKLAEEFLQMLFKAKSTNPNQ